MKLFGTIIAVACICLLSLDVSQPINAQLKVKATSPHSASLSCTEPALPAGVPPVTSFNFYRGTTAGGESPTPIGSSATCAYDDTTVVAGTTYFWTAAAVNSAGTSAMSNETSGTIPNLVAPPAPVQNPPVVQ